MREDGGQGAEICLEYRICGDGCKVYICGDQSQ